MTKPLKVGLAGTGRIAYAHLNAYRQIADKVKLVSVCDVREDALERFAKSADISEKYSDYNEMLKKADLDAVDLCTSHDQHESQVIAAAECGKHVLVEKAMGRSLQESRNMIAAAENKGVTFMVGQDLRYLPHSLAIKQHIERGDLGTVRVTRCASIKNDPFGFPAGDWLLDGSRAGGGILISVTSHQIDLLRYFLGNVKTVSGICRSAHPEYINGAEEYISANLEFENGAIGDILGIYSPIRSPLALQYMILGDEGSIYSTPPAAEHQIHQFGPGMISTKKIDSQIAADAGSKFGHFIKIDPSYDRLTSDDPFVNEILHFAECCRTGKEPLTSGKDNLNTLKVVFGIYESARTGNRISLDALQEGRIK